MAQEPTRKKRVPKTPYPLKRLNEELGGKVIPGLPPHKLPERPFPWRRLTVIFLSGIVIGNSSVTLLLYALNRPELTAWTGHVSQSTPSAVNDLVLAIVLLVMSLFLLRNHDRK